jgi:hypothetical protein
MSRAETLEEVLLQLIQSGLGATKAYSVVAELRETPYVPPNATQPPAGGAPEAKRHTFKGKEKLEEMTKTWLEGGEGRHIYAESSAGGLDDAPEAGAMTGVPIDNSETWDWGPEDWIESYISQIAALRADLATVTSNHKQTLTALAIARDMMNESADDLAAEREHADGLRDALFRSAEHAHLHERHHDGELLDCKLTYCIGEVTVIRAHDARRASEGGEA